MTLPIEQFLNFLHAEKGYSPNTLRTYRVLLMDLHVFLQQNELVWRNINATEIRNHLAEISEKKQTASTLRLRLAAYESFYKWAMLTEQVQSSPVKQIRRPKMLRKSPKILQVEDISAIIEHPKTRSQPWMAVRDRALLEVLYGAGLRISEVCGLLWEDVNFNKGWVLVRKGKGGKQRYTPLGTKTLQALRRWKNITKASAYIFFGRYMGPMTAKQAYNIVRTTGIENGFNKLNPHLLRHACATHMMLGGADLREVQEMLGHESISTTQIYTQYSNMQLLEIYEKASLQDDSKTNKKRGRPKKRKA